MVFDRPSIAAMETARKYFVYEWRLDQIHCQYIQLIFFSTQFMMDVESLEIVRIFGFDGTTKHGLQLHPDQKHFVYSMGNMITIKNIESGKQDSLSGHTNVVTTLSVSPCGSFIASGQLTHLGFKAAVIVWNYETQTVRGTYEIHKVKVEDVCFTSKGNYLVSLGGKDDGNIVIWDVCNNSAICGSYASTGIAGNAITIASTHSHNQCFLSGGEGTLKLWQINSDTRKVLGVNVKVGKLRRTINCLAIDEMDQESYCGTSTGDIIRIRLNLNNDPSMVESNQSPVMIGCYSKISDNPKKQKSGDGDLYSGGISSILLLPAKKMIVGTGDGTIELVDIMEISSKAIPASVKIPTTPQLKTRMNANVKGAVTSLVKHGKNCILVGTSFCEIYQISLSDFQPRVIVVCHTDVVYDIAFPQNFSEIFATGSKNDIRLWQLATQRELLRITVPNFACTSLCFSYDGKLIMSAWNDGIVRAFKSQSGSLFFAIENAHVKAVSAICLTKDGQLLVTGGCDGQVRIWHLSKDVRHLKALFKEHRGPITALHLSYNDTEVVSSSTDGTCIIWNLQECCRKQILMGNTMHMSARYSPNALQILTCGADRKVGYWETLDGSLLREVEGSTVGPINTLDISPDGKYFITGSNDCLVRFWDYHSADVTHIGKGHAAIVTSGRFSSDSNHVVTASADGAVIIWKNPIPSQLPSSRSSHSSRSNSSKLTERSQREKKIGSTSERSNSGDSIRTVHQSKESHETCEYDPIKPFLDSCRCGDKKEESTPTNSATSRSQKQLYKTAQSSEQFPIENKSSAEKKMVLATVTDSM